MGIILFLVPFLVEFSICNPFQTIAASLPKPFHVHHQLALSIGYEKEAMQKHLSRYFQWLSVPDL